GPQNPINRYLLSTTPARAIGKISYPLYLWHWPLLSFGYIVCNGIPDRTSRMVLLASAFLLATLTTRLIEPRFRGKSDSKSLHFLVLSNAAVLIVGGLCWTGMFLPRQHDPNLESVVRAPKDWGFPPRSFAASAFEGMTLYEKGAGPHATLFY